MLHGVQVKHLHAACNTRNGQLASKWSNPNHAIRCMMRPFIASTTDATRTKGRGSASSGIKIIKVMPWSAYNNAKHVNRSIIATDNRYVIRLRPKSSPDEADVNAKAASTKGVNSNVWRSQSQGGKNVVSLDPALQAFRTFCGRPRM